MMLGAGAGLPSIEDKGDGMPLPLTIPGQSLQQHVTCRFELPRAREGGHPRPAQKVISIDKKMRCHLQSLK